MLEEVKKINKSLSVFGMVINVLMDGKLLYVFYRDLKFICILQEFLGGNSWMIFIINCFFFSYNDVEIFSMFCFGMCVKFIKNKVKVNVEFSFVEFK